MKIIHVDDNKYALDDIRKDIPQIVPGAELHSFDHPDPALAFAGTEGCDVLMTEVELWSERLAGIRLAKAMKKINPRVNILPYRLQRERGRPRAVRSPDQRFYPETLEVGGTCGCVSKPALTDIIRNDGDEPFCSHLPVMNGWHHTDNKVYWN